MVKINTMLKDIGDYAIPTVGVAFITPALEKGLRDALGTFTIPGNIDIAELGKVAIGAWVMRGGISKDKIATRAGHSLMVIGLYNISRQFIQ